MGLDTLNETGKYYQSVRVGNPFLINMEWIRRPQFPTNPILRETSPIKPSGNPSRIGFVEALFAGGHALRRLRSSRKYSDIEVIGQKGWYGGDP